jgi:hypothetical protein
MSFVNSPKIKYAADGKPREQLGCGSQIARALTILLVLIALALVLYPFVTTNLYSRIVQTDGTVRGTVVNSQKNPIANAEVFLVTAPNQIVKTDANGAFALDQVPSGKQVIIVVLNEIGQEYPVQIQSGTATQVGALAYIAPPDK